MTINWSKFTLRFIGLSLLIIVVYKAIQKEEDINQKIEVSIPDIRIDPLKVRAEPALKKTLIQSISATGVCEAIQRVQLSSRLSAEIIKIMCKEGNYYSQGDTLILFDDKELRIALREVEDDYLKAQSDYATQRGDYATLSLSKDSKLNLQELRKRLESAQRKRKDGAHNEKEIEQLKEEVEFAEILAGDRLDEVLRTRSGFSVAKTRKLRAELMLQNSAIIAPFSGFATSIRVSQGQVVQNGQQCLEFVNISKICVEIGILEKEVPFIKVGNMAQVVFPAFPKDTLIGKVTALSPVISTETKTAKAIIELQNVNHKYKPGMYATVLVQSAFFPNRVVIPKRAIIERDGRKIVFVAQSTERGNALAKWNYVTTGVENATEIEITEGIKPGMLVITENNFTLSHDMPITLINEPQSPK